jgi:Pectate lyase superfamily protein
MRVLLLIEAFACFAPLCFSGQAPGLVRRPTLPEIEKIRSTVVNVRGFGARGDGKTDDTAAIQAAIDFSFGPASAPNGTSYYLNHPLYFPAGQYMIKSPLIFTKVQGARVTGDGRFATTITNTSGTGVIATNGCSYSHWEGIALMGTGSATIFDLNWDNTPGGDALQSNTFQDMSFSGGNISIDIGEDGYMGSENLFLNCKWIWQKVASVKTSNYNALQNTIVGGNISHSAIGVWMHFGTVSLYNVGFQASEHYDVQVDNSAHAAIVISGTRTESTNFFLGTNGMNIKLEGVSQDNTAPGIFVNHSGQVSIDGCHSVNGKITGNMIGSIQSSTFGRDDWLQADTRHSNLNLSSIISPSRYLDSAVFSSSGFSYPLQRVLVPIPANNGTASTVVRGGTLVHKINVVLVIPDAEAIVNVGDDSNHTRYLKNADISGHSIESTSTDSYYAADNHILVSCAGVKCAQGYVAIEYEHVAVHSAW